MHYQDERNFGCRISDSWTFRGHKTVIMENEQIRVVVLVDKGADIYQFVHKNSDTDFLWRSPWGVRSTSSFLPTTGNEVWMDTYEGGWQTVLPGGGSPSVYGDADMGLHAEVNTIPWDCVILEDTPNRVKAKFSVRTYRTPFFFEKILTLELGRPVLTLDQRLTNESEEDVHCVWGEHIALGAPFLSDKCIIDLPQGKIINHPDSFHENNKLQAGLESEWPFTKLSDGAVYDLSKIPGKNFCSYDISYITNMAEGWYGVTNTEVGVGFALAYPVSHYKYLWYWQSFGGASGYPWYGRTYNVGLEPFTSYTNEGLVKAVENGSALLVRAGQSIESQLSAAAYESFNGIEGFSLDGDVKVKS